MTDLAASRFLRLAFLALCILGTGCTGRPDWRRIALVDASGAPLSGAPFLDIENARGTVTVQIDPRAKPRPRRKDESAAPH